MGKAKAKKRLTGKQRARRAFNLGRTRFQVFLKAELKKFIDKHGYKPKGYSEAGQDWKGIMKRAGAAYRRKYH